MRNISISNDATRHDRAECVRRGDLATVDGELKQFLLGILQAYDKDGEGELDPKKLGDFLTVQYGGVSEGMSRLGQPAAILDAFRRMQAGLYAWVRPSQ